MEKMMGMYIYLVNRCKEPSTHSALSALMLSVGLSVDTGFIHNVLILISLAFGGMGFFVKEGKAETVIK